MCEHNCGLETVRVECYSQVTVDSVIWERHVTPWLSFEPGEVDSGRGLPNGPDIPYDLGSRYLGLSALYRPLGGWCSKAKCVLRKVPKEDDAGSSLILALVFLIVGSLIVAALTTWTMNGITNVSRFQVNRATLYAANSEAELALWGSRYTYPASLSGYQCPDAGPETFNGISVVAWCSTVTNVEPTISREVTISVYPGGVPLSSQPATSPLLVGVVGFDDTSSNQPLNQCRLTTSGPTYCGFAMEVLSWKVQQSSGT